jgi:hypothetical protein
MSVPRLLSIAAAAAVLALAAALPAHAQQPDDGLTGKRVRVTAPNFADQRVVGTVTAYTDQRLVVTEDETGEVFEFPLRAVSRLDPFMGGSSGSTAWYRGRLGAFIGSALGLVGGAALGFTGDGDPLRSTLIGGAVGLGAGATAGALHGAAFPRERWGWVMNPWGYDPELRPDTP